MSTICALQTVLADTTMLRRIPFPTVYCFLLPWAFTSFHQALGNPGKTLAQPPNQDTAGGDQGMEG